MTNHFMLATFSPDKTWLVIMLAAAMIVMAYIDLKYLKIHNVLTFPVIFAGWIFSLVNGWMNGADIEVYLPTHWLGFQKFILGNGKECDFQAGLFAIDSVENVFDVRGCNFPFFMGMDSFFALLSP